jgi:hypothetical protein
MGKEKREKRKHAGFMVLCSEAILACDAGLESGAYR